MTLHCWPQGAVAPSHLGAALAAQVRGRLLARPAARVLAVDGGQDVAGLDARPVGGAALDGRQDELWTRRGRGRRGCERGWLLPAS